jgi:hypothetical protein
MEKIKWSEKVTNEQVLGLIGEKRTLINNIRSKKMETTVHQLSISIFHKSLNLLISSILNNINNSRTLSLSFGFQRILFKLN